MKNQIKYILLLSIILSSCQKKGLTQNGLYIEQNKSGNVSLMGVLQLSQKEGIWTTFDNNGIAKEQYYYLNDKLKNTINPTIPLKVIADKENNFQFISPSSWVEEPKNSERVLIVAKSANYNGDIKPTYNVTKTFKSNHSKSNNELFKESILELKKLKGIEFIQSTNNSIIYKMTLENKTEITIHAKTIYFKDYYLTLTFASNSIIFKEYEPIFKTGIISFGKIS